MHGVALAQQQANSTTGDAKTVLRGTVVNSVTHQPVGRAVVLSQDGRFAVMTNDRGQFEMRFKVKKNAPPAGDTVRSASNGAATYYPAPTTTYTSGGRETSRLGPTPIDQAEVDRPAFLTARRTGYLNMMRHGGSVIAISADQEEVTIPLTPEARVIGHVTLADGEGARGMQVALYRRTVENGSGQWRPAGQAEVKSDGEFRIVDVEAGDYKLFTMELPDRDPVTSDARGQLFGYPPDYYPGAADFETGAVIHVTAGETFQASLTPERRRYYPVTIEGTSPEAGNFANVEVWKNGHPGPGYTLGYNFRTGQISGTLPDGEYVVKVSNQGDNAAMGMTNISVHGGPANGSVTLMGGAVVVVKVNEQFGNSGQLQARRQAIAEQPGISDSQRKQMLLGVQVILWPTEGFQFRNNLRAQPPGDPEADGLEISNVTAGEYRVQVETQTGYVASVRSGGTDLRKANLVVAAGSTVPPIEVELRDDGGEIDGTVVDGAKGNGAAVQGANAELGFVYFMPEEEAAGSKYTSIQPNGNFQVTQLAPGTYRVVAFGKYKQDLEWSNEEVMKKYNVQSVTIAPGQKENIRISLSSEE
jgi:hypothetical protein